MNVALVALGVALLMVPSALAGRAPRIRAGFVVGFSRATVPSGLGLIMIGMLATAVPAALELASLSGLAALCERLIHHMVVGGRYGTLIGGVLSLMLVVAALRGVLRARRHQARAYVDEGIGTHLHSKESTLVVLPVDAHVAFATPGSPPQLVVSRGAVKDFPALQRQVVVEHERAHLAGRHHVDLRIIAAVLTALGWLPGIRRGMGLWREALEWAADDAAAKAVGSRASVAQTIEAWAGSSQVMSLSFGGTDRVARRLTYLSGPMPGACPVAAVTWAVVAVLWLGAGLLLARWLNHAHALAVGTAICPL